jgi:hypothetical protein
MESAAPPVRLRALRADDHAACLALLRPCDDLAVRVWGGRASAFGRLIDRNPSLSWIAQHPGRLVGAVLCGHDGWRLLKDVSLVSLELGLVTLN